MSNGNLSGYDANDYEPSMDFSPIPAGKYRAAIVASEMRDTKRGDGQYLYLEIEILDGEHKGRKLFDRLNLVNPSEQAEEIAKRQLSSICRACGNMTPDDSGDLHDRPMTVSVGVENRSDTGEPANRVKGYSRPDGDRGAQERPADPAPAPAPARTERKRAPWGKRKN